jgi:hypothetical protein
MNHAILTTISIIVVGVFALVMINSVPIVHAQSIFPVPPPPTSQIIPQLGTIISAGHGQLVTRQGNCILTAGHGQLTINCNPTPPPPPPQR